MSKMKFHAICYSLFILLTASVASAQSGSLTGSSALVKSSGRTLKVPEASLTYQAAPRQKVFQVEDLVKVHVKLDWKYNNIASNQRKKSIKTSAKLTAWFKIPDLLAMPVAMNDDLPGVGGNLDHKTQNQGTMQRSENLDFTITCRVVSVQDNGHLIIEGTRNTFIGEENVVMYVGGTIRPDDIGPNNTVEGSSVDGLTVKNLLDGNINDTVRRTWAARLIEHWKPF